MSASRNEPRDGMAPEMNSVPVGSTVVDALSILSYDDKKETTTGW